MAWLCMFSYYGNISEEGLVLSDIFGKKVIPWNDILRVKTDRHNEDFWAYIVVTTNDKYLVRANCDNFEDLLVKNSNLELYKTGKRDPQHYKIWNKTNTPYKYIDLQDWLNDKLNQYDTVK